MTARSIFQARPVRRQVLSADMTIDMPVTNTVGGGWAPPESTIHPDGSVTVPAKYVNKAGTPVPGERLNPDGSVTLPPSTIDWSTNPTSAPSSGGGGGGGIAPVQPTQPTQPAVQKADFSKYLLPLALLGAVAVGGYLVMKGKKR